MDSCLKTPILQRGVRRRVSSSLVLAQKQYRYPLLTSPAEYLTSLSCSILGIRSATPNERHSRCTHCICAHPYFYQSVSDWSFGEKVILLHQASGHTSAGSWDWQQDCLACRLWGIRLLQEIWPSSAVCLWFPAARRPLIQPLMPWLLLSQQGFQSFWKLPWEVAAGAWGWSAGVSHITPWLCVFSGGRKYAKQDGFQSVCSTAASFCEICGTIWLPVITPLSRTVSASPSVNCVIFVQRKNWRTPSFQPAVKPRQLLEMAGCLLRNSWRTHAT